MFRAQPFWPSRPFPLQSPSSWFNRIQHLMFPLIAPTGIGERSFPIRRADTTASPSCIDTASLSPCLLRRRAVPSSSRRGPWAQQAIEGLPPPRTSKGSKFKDLIPTPRGIEHKDYRTRQNQLQENNSLTVNFFNVNTYPALSRSWRGCPKDGIPTFTAERCG